MSNEHENSAVETAGKPAWLRTLVVLTAGMGWGLFLLTCFPSALEQARRFVAQPISNAIASDSASFISPAAARAQRLASAKTVVHGMFVKDSYGCAYVFQYLSAKLTLTPVLDERKQPVCDK